MTSKLKYIYIIFLLIVASLLVFIAQGLYTQETTSLKPIEFSRTDGYNAELGKISVISVRINNDDFIKHIYTIQLWKNSVFYKNETVEVYPDKPFTLSMTILTEKQYSESGELINKPTHNASIVVFRDDSFVPKGSIEFSFN